jgi:hypothetical protein
MHNIVHEPISTTYYMTPYHQSVCLYVYPPVVSIQAVKEELFDVSFSMRYVSYHVKRQLNLHRTSCSHLSLQRYCLFYASLAIAEYSIYYPSA